MLLGFNVGFLTYDSKFLSVIGQMGNQDHSQLPILIDVIECAAYIADGQPVVGTYLLFRVG